VERFAEAAERAGFIVAGSNTSRNGPIQPVVEAINSLITDTHQRFAIDQSRLYAAGFSGGSRVALSWAQNGRIAGVVACGASFGARGIPEKVSFQLYLAAGIDDFNHDELWETSRTLAQRGTLHRFIEFDGAHEWLPATLATDALEFFAGRVPPKPAPDSKQYRKEASRYFDTNDRLWLLDAASRRRMLERLQRDGARAQDGPDRRIARRVLGGTLVRGIEEGRRLMRAKEYRTAAEMFDTAAAARPDRGELWYSAAVAYAAGGMKQDALRTLEQAFARGFADAGRVRGEPLLEPLRTDPRYQTLVER
jgi:tetratricopeptide (TPR) repeat protein